MTVFSQRIRTQTLVVLCRSLGTMLHAGVAIKKAFRVAAQKTSDRRAQEALEAIHTAVSAGDDVASAIREQGEAFPRLMVDMVAVAEQTGTLPEVLLSLSQHYESNLRLRKEFLRGIAWPLFQLVAAVLIIALVILLLGWMAEFQNRNPKEVDILGWGLIGPSGAINWLAMTFGSAAAAFVGYQVASRSLSGKQLLDPLLMKIPVLGSCLRAFGLARFSWAYALTQQAGMPIDRSIEASLRATANGAFIGQTARICAAVNAGDDFSDALAQSRLFPDEFLEIVRVAETSGTVPEALERLSPQFEDQARNSLNALVAAMSWLVWMLVAAFIVFVIFSIFMWYMDLLSSALDEVNG